MPLQYLAGQPLTADDLQNLAETRIVQGFDQSVVSSTTLADTAIVVPVRDMTKIELDIRYTSLGGGISWAWAITSGAVTCYNRSITSAGQSPTGNAASISAMRHRQIATIQEVQATAHYTTNTSQLILERLVCDGRGEIMFRFAQETSNANPTSLYYESYALYRRLSA